MKIQPLYGNTPKESTAPGLAPANVEGMEFHIVATKAYCSDTEEEWTEDSVDAKCVFAAGNKFKKIHEEEPEEGEVDTETFTYTKTGPNTAFVRRWRGRVTPDGYPRGSIACEARLTFTSDGVGCAKFVTYGHGYETFGAATFTLKKK